MAGTFSTLRAGGSGVRRSWTGKDDIISSIRRRSGVFFFVLFIPFVGLDEERRERKGKRGFNESCSCKSSREKNPFDFFFRRFAVRKNEVEQREGVLKKRGEGRRKGELTLYITL